MAGHTVGSLFPIALILSGFAVAAAFVLLGLGETGYAIAAGVLFAIVAAFGASDTLLTRRQVKRHGGDVQAAVEDAADPVPVIPLNEETPYAVTPEADPHRPPAPPRKAAAHG